MPGPAAMSALARIGWRCLLLCVCLLPAAWAQAAGPQVYAAVVSGNTLFVGGEFTIAGRANLVAFDLQTGAVNTGWLADTDGPVRSLALSANGTLLFVGGEFTQVRNTPRRNIAAVGTGSGVLSVWNPGADGPVYAMARSAGGQVLYAGGDFTEIGGAPRSRLASLSTQIPAADGSTETGGALPWVSPLDAPVRAIALDEAAGRVYVGGDFATAGGQARAGLAALSIASAAVLPWDPGLAAAARVRALFLAGEVLYVGGDYTVGPYSHLTALDTVTAGPIAWDAGVNGEVRALVAIPDGSRLYVGGTFSQAGGLPRSQIAGFRTDDGVGELMFWNPGGDSAIDSIDALAIHPASTFLYVGGAFTRIAGVDVPAPIVASNVEGPTTEVDPPGGSYQEPGMVSLTCDGGAAPCLMLCYRLDGAAPAIPDDCAFLGGGPGPVQVPVADTELTFFSENLLGKREPVRTERYVVDNLPPQTTISLPGGLYGLDGIRDVVLTCKDNKAEFGCTSHYTLDGTAPDLSSTVYQAPISLSSLFPDPSIPANEVDPLLHMAGEVTLRVFSVDGAGNVEETQTRVFQVDLAPPRVIPTHASGSYVGPQTIGLQCDDGAGSGCAELFYRLDGVEPQLDEDGEPVPAARRYGGPLELDTAASLSVRALDQAGNVTSGIIAVYAFTAPSLESRSGVGGIDPLLLALLLPWLGRRGGRTRA